MPVRITCSQCSTKLKVADELRGKSIKCPKCAKVLKAAAESEETPKATARVAPPKKAPVSRSRGIIWRFDCDNCKEPLEIPDGDLPSKLVFSTRGRTELPGIHCWKCNTRNGFLGKYQLEKAELVEAGWRAAWERRWRRKSYRKRLLEMPIQQPKQSERIERGDGTGFSLHPWCSLTGQDCLVFVSRAFFWEIHVLKVAKVKTAYRLKDVTENSSLAPIEETKHLYIHRIGPDLYQFYEEVYWGPAVPD